MARQIVLCILLTYWCVILADPDVKDAVTNFILGPSKTTVPGWIIIMRNG